LLRDIKLAVFDLDGTLTKPISSWEHLHRHLGTWEANGKDNLVKFLAKEITYDEFAYLDAINWKGTPVTKIKEIAAKIEYINGAELLIRKLKEKGIEIALISGGLSVIAEKVARDFEIKYWWANELVEKNGVLTGEVKVHVSFNGKLIILQKLLKALKIKPDQVISFGDTDGDLCLFQNSGISIAINPISEDVAQAADYVVESFKQVLALKII